MKEKVRPAIQELIAETDEIAKSNKGIESEEINKIFSKDD